MSEFYKMEPLKWDRGTDNLTLEQEAAYLRICNAIYAADQPIAENYRALAGMWRCNERRAKRLLAELVDAGKVYVEAGWIKNDKAISDVAMRLELRVKRQLAGHSGGIESGKSRAKALENKETHEANGSTRKEVEKSSVAKATGGRPAIDRSEAIWGNGKRYLVRHGVSEKNAGSLIGRWLKLAGADAVYDALAAANAAGSPDPVAYITAALKPKSDQKLGTWEIADAEPVRPIAVAWDRDSEASAGTPDVPRMLAHEEGSAPEDRVSVGDDDIGWSGGSLPSLRLVAGGAL